MIKKLARLARYIGEFKKSTLITPLLMVGEVALEITIWSIKGSNPSFLHIES